MASQICIPQVQCCAVRVTSLNLNGSVVVGSSSSYLTDTLVKATRKAIVEEGDEIKEKNACGTTLVDFKSPPTLVRYDMEFDFMTDDPQLQSVMIPGSAILSVGGATGLAGPAIGVLSGQVGVELWTKRVNNGVVDSTFPYAHWLFPYVQNLRNGDREFASSVGHFLVNGEAGENANWFDGPANDWPAVASSRAWQWIPTATLPTPNCEFATVAS